MEIDPNVLGVIIGAAIAAATGGTMGVQRMLRGKRDDSSATSMISVKEAERRAAAIKAEADHVAQFAALLKEVRDHHKDDDKRFREIEDEMARIDSEINRLRDHRHKIDTDSTRYAFQIAELERRIMETRSQVGLDSGVHRPPKPRPR